MSIGRQCLSCIATAALPLLSLACGNVENSAPSDPSGKVELFSWWISGGEDDALNAALAVHKKKYPNVDVVNLTGKNATVARDQLVLRMQRGDPPDSFQVNIGEDLMKWVKSNGIDASESPLQPIDSFVSKDVFYPAVVEQASAGDAFYAVPMNVHRINLSSSTSTCSRAWALTNPRKG